MKLKELAIGLVLLAIPGLAIAAPSTGDNEQSTNDQLGLQLNSSQYALRVTSSGHVIPGIDRGADLGSPLNRFRNVYSASMTVGGELQFTTATRTNLGNFTAYPSSAGITIPYTGTYVVLTSTEGAIAMTATPQISTASAKNGDLLIVRSSTGSVIIADNAGIAAGGLKLGAATRTLGVDDIIGFIFTDGFWQEIFFANN